MNNRHMPANLYRILRSFLTLAETLNLSKTTKALQVTRQSVRRHIDWLEDQTGCRLFTYEHNQFGLTSAGSSWMSEVSNLLDQTELLFGASSTLINGLPSVHFKITDDHQFFAQQHPVVKVWNDKTPPLIKRGLEAWVLSQSALDHQAMQVIRPFLLVYRQLRSQWVCTEVGEKSSYATWLGPTWARSAVGQAYDDDPIKSQADQFMLRAHAAVSRTGFPWYDHISTKFPRRESGELVPVNYQKLVMPCHFPDGSPAVAILVARTDNVTIEGLDPKDIPVTPTEEKMEFDI